MNKGTLTSGDKILWFRMEMRIQRGTFATALADHYYSEGEEEFPNRLTKKAAEKILKIGLYFYGIYGRFADGFFEAAAEEGERYNNIYEVAEQWVDKNHRHLAERPEINSQPTNP
jgi:hypothetical protein